MSHSGEDQHNQRRLSKRRNKASNKIHDYDAGTPEILSIKESAVEQEGRQRAEKAHEQKSAAKHQRLASSGKK